MAAGRAGGALDPMTRKPMPVGNTVDIKTATYKNTIGAVELKAVWTDGEFDPSLDAFYYARVLQIPTPRWSTYDAARLGVPPPASVPATVQERAWTSPVWYTPTAEARKDAPKGVTVADLKGKGATALDDAQLKDLIVGKTLDIRNTVTGQRFEIVYGADGKRVIIADADFHRPTLHRIANTAPRKGFTDLLAGTTKLTETMTPITDNVQLASRGGSLTAPARTGLGTDRLTKILGDMSSEADFVLLDSSPILLIPDNLYMAAAADGVVLVVAVGQTRPRDLLRTKSILERAGTPIVGVVLNRTPVKHLNSYYKQYSGYYSS